jgi:hypothetical protein
VSFHQIFRRMDNENEVSEGPSKPEENEVSKKSIDIHFRDLSEMEERLEKVDLSTIEYIDLCGCKNVQNFVDRLEGGKFHNLILTSTDVERIPLMTLYYLEIDRCEKLRSENICLRGVWNVSMAYNNVSSSLEPLNYPDHVNLTGCTIESLSPFEMVKSLDLRCTGITKEQVEKYLPRVVKVHISKTEIDEYDD